MTYKTKNITFACHKKKHFVVISTSASSTIETYLRCSEHADYNDVCYNCTMYYLHVL